MFLLVPAYPGCPGSKAVKRSLLLLFFSFMKLTELPLTVIPLHMFLLCMKLTELPVFLPLSLQVNHLDEVSIAIPLHMFSICMKFTELHLFFLCVKLTELPVFATKFAGKPLRQGTYCDSLAFVFSFYEIDRTALGRRPVEKLI